jgi:mannose-6-phosphate isomerase-like protein (cupin superfamily)
MAEDKNMVWGQRIISRPSEIKQREGYKGYWEKISEEGRTGALTKKGVETIKKALGCKEIRLIHPETGFEQCGLDLGVTTIPPKGTNLQHKHNCWEVFYVLSGKGKFVIEGKEFWAEKGDAVNIPPNTSHKSFNEGEEPWAYLYVTSPPLNAIMDDIESATKFGYITVMEEDLEK